MSWSILALAKTDKCGLNGVKILISGSDADNSNSNCKLYVNLSIIHIGVAIINPTKPETNNSDQNCQHINSL